MGILLLVQLSTVVIRHHSKRQLRRGKLFIQLPSYNPSPEQGEAGTCRQHPGKRAAYWLVSVTCSARFVITQGHLHRRGTAHNELGSPAHLPAGGTFPIKDPSAPMTLA